MRQYEKNLGKIKDLPLTNKYSLSTKIYTPIKKKYIFQEAKNLRI